MNVLTTIIRKEFGSYFKTYTAYIVLGIYLLLSFAATFYSGYFFELNNRSLVSFFIYQPEILIVLLPALTMKMWAEERRQGTLEFLLTQPITPSLLVWGKFLAAWLFSVGMLLMILPFVVYISHFVVLDKLNLMAEFTGLCLVMGALCALGCVVSACHKNVIVAYLSTVFCGWLWENVNFDFILFPIKKAMPLLSQQLNGILNFKEHYVLLEQGQIGAETLMYFMGIIVISLWLNTLIVQRREN